MNIIVVGAGAIGCYVGGRLAASGVRVILVGRPRTIEPLALNGLTVTDLQGFNAHVTADLNATTPSTLSVASNLKLAWVNLAARGDASTENTVVLLCVKGGATTSATQEIIDCCPAGTVIVSLQNGVDNVARIAQIAPQMTVLAGMVPYNVVMKTATHVHRATMGQIYIETSAISQKLVAKLNAAGLKASASSEMKSVQWGKLLLNVNNPINALSDRPLRDELQDRDFRFVFATLQMEALAAMKKAGIMPTQLATVKPHVMPLMLKLPNWLFTRVAKKMLRMDASARSSMWDDVQQGRTTEIDDLCGAVVRLANQVGTAAPCNAEICKLMAKHSKGQRFTGRELRQALRI